MGDFNMTYVRTMRSISARTMLSLGKNSQRAARSITRSDKATMYMSRITSQKRGVAISVWPTPICARTALRDPGSPRAHARLRCSLS